MLLGRLPAPRSTVQIAPIPPTDSLSKLVQRLTSRANMQSPSAVACSWSTERQSSERHSEETSREHQLMVGTAGQKRSGAPHPEPTLRDKENSCPPCPSAWAGGDCRGKAKHPACSFPPSQLPLLGEEESAWLQTGTWQGRDSPKLLATTAHWVPQSMQKPCCGASRAKPALRAQKHPLRLPNSS